MWRVAEEKLQKSLDEFTAQTGDKWEMNEGDGAFYGPKIDITIRDALKREYQCATIQLDFNLPQRFNLEYMTAEIANKPKGDDEQKGDAAAATTTATASASAEATTKPAPAPATATASASASAVTAAAKPEPTIKEPPPGYARPVMIHRAIYGSFERFIAILTEHFAGKWPFWLSPRQILVIPVMPSANDYVKEVQAIFRKHHLHADSDIGGNTMQKKIRTGQLQQYNFIFVVGAQERDSRTVNIRNRDDPSTQAKGELVPLDEAIAKLVRLRDERRLVNAM